VKSLVIYAHPNPASLNNAIKETAIETLSQQGEVRVHDLYALKFQPVLSGDDFGYYAQGTVAPEIAPLQTDIAWADQIVVIFPTYWAGMPAILKGYLDRVFTYGFAYRLGADGLEQPLAGKKVFVFQTTGSPAAVLGPQIDAFKLIAGAGIFGFIGWETVAHRIFDGVSSSTPEQRAAWLAEVKEILTTAVKA
jgi:NAD(P)H dehydrogenase (quinone)